MADGGWMKSPGSIIVDPDVVLFIRLNMKCIKFHPDMFKKRDLVSITTANFSLKSVSCRPLVSEHPL